MFDGRLRWTPSKKVSAAQANAALMAAGLYEEVAGWAADPSTDVLHRLAFNKGTTFRRDRPALAAGASKLGWSDEMLVQLFIAADKIKLQGRSRARGGPPH